MHAAPFEVPTLYFHGTKADRRAGDLIGPGFRSNFGPGRAANHVYFAATLDAAIWGPSWRPARGASASTSSSRRATSRTTPT